MPPTTRRANARIRKLLGTDTTPVMVVDVGSARLAPANIAYGPLLRGDLCRVLGFEPDTVECSKLNARYAPRHRFLPSAVFDGAEHLLYQTNMGATTSLYQPDLALMSRFENLAELCQVESTRTVATVRLDEVPEVWDDVDYLKADIQGAELIMLQHAGRILSQAVAVQVEVEFLPIYCDQPLFADVDRHLRESGFWLTDVVDRGYRQLRMPDGGVAGRVPQVRMDDRGVLLWADAIYMRPPAQWEGWSSRKLRAAALIFDEVLGSRDMAHAVLTIHDRKFGTDFETRAGTKRN